jgi:hypothetical protein
MNEASNISQILLSITSELDHKTNIEKINKCVIPVVVG